MSPETLKALKASIRKWDANAAAETSQEYLTGRTDCPLCTLFYDQDCERCPIKEQTGAIHCFRTPYDKAEVFGTGDWDEVGADKDAAQVAAREEAAFLRSLLPKGEEA